MTGETCGFFYNSPYLPNPSIQNSVVERPIGAETYLTKDLIQATFTQNPADLNTIFRSRQSIARYIAIYGPRLANIDYVRFKFLNPHQRQALEEELLNTARLLYDECQLHLFEKDITLLKERGRQLELTAKLLYRLRNTPELGENHSPEEQLQAEIVDGSLDQPVKYIALTVIAPLIAETMKSISASEGLEYIQEKMTDANLYRLNWVAEGGFVKSLLGLIPAGSGHIQHTQNILDTVKPYTGYMSFVLYYLRLGIRLYLLTKGTFKGDEKAMDEISIGERFNIQWEKHGFGIINDFFWATANMACFLWLIKAGTWGCTAYMGNGLTAALLLMDLFLIVCQHNKKKKEHDDALAQYDQDINRLKQDIHKAPNDLKKVLDEHLTVLTDAKNTCALEWKSANKDFYSTAVYAAGLLAGFSLICCFFFPPTGIPLATALILGLVGATLSFVLTLAYHSMITNTKIEQLEELMGQTEAQITDLELKKQSAPNLNQKALIDQDIIHLNKKLVYQKDMISHHRKEMIQQMFSEAMLPATVFVFLVFLPLNLGMPLMLPIIALLLLSSSILARFKPPEPEVTNVNGAPSPMNPS